MSGWGMKAKMSLAVSLLIVTIIAALSYVALSFFRQEMKRNVSDQQFMLVSALAEEIDDKLAAAQGELTSVAATFPRDFSRAQESLDARRDTRLIFDNCVALVTPAGRMFAISPFEPYMLLKDYSGREYFRRTMESGRPYISEPFATLQKHGRPIIMMTAPLLDEREKIEAVLIGSIDLTRHNFLGKLAQLKLGTSGYVYLVAPDGTMIMHPDESRIMKKDVPAGGNRLLARALAGFEGSGETVNSHGVPMLASFKRLKTTGWILAASTPLSEAYGSVTKARNFLLTGLIVSVLISVSIVWALMNFLTVPLGGFTRHVQTFEGKSGAGRFFPRNRGDEIGILAAAFNRMVETLDRENEALSSSEAKFALAFNSSPDCIAITRLHDGRVMEVNEATVANFGYQRQEMIGRTTLELGLWTRQEDRAAMMEAVERDGKVENRDFRFRTRNGEIRSALYSARKIDHGGETCLLSVIRDVTELKQAEENLRKRTRELAAKHVQQQVLYAEMEEKNRALEQAYAELKSAQAQVLQQEKMASIGQLAAGVAHEINNPIGFVSSNLGTLRKYLERLTGFIGLQGERLTGAPPEVAAELAQRRKTLKLDYIMDDAGKLIDESLDGTERVRKIVADLKSFSRVDEAETKVVDINECVESTLNIAWNEIKYKATVKKDLGDIPAIRCNPQQLNQVFLNLLVNAAHAIEGQGEIGIGTSLDGQHVAVRVSDTGCGIPEEIRGRIFEPFFTTKEVGKGTGLGLSISYDIVKKHGGEISVESEPGKGTTFTVRIPTAQRS